MKKHHAIGFGLATLLLGNAAYGHSVGQVQTAKRIAQSTIIMLDPQGNPTPGGQGTDTTAQVGDILSFVIQFTPVPNNATRGAGGYITEYIPQNTEVVGARILDADGNTIVPQRGPWMDDGWGPRNRHDEFDGLGLEQGSLSQVYADTGIFFSTDARSPRQPDDVFISVFNGLEMNPDPTGVNGLGDLLGIPGGPYYSHNDWDLIQAYAYGVNGGWIVSDGKGNTPFGYGSAVAGPQTHYQYEAVDVPACMDGVDNDNAGGTDYPDDAGCASAIDDDETNASDGPVGPWQRIRYVGSEIGVGGATDCENCQAEYVRVGIPVPQNLEGWDLSPDNPLPANANAVRFAVGELIVGQEYLAEISLRVLDLPLDPIMTADVNCAEVFGGDAAMPQNGQDNTWRYFLPAPSCVQLNLVFELSVDTLIAVSGDTLTYHIHGKNLSVNDQTNVQVTDTFVAGDVAWGQVVAGPAPTVGNGTLTWPVMTLTPGQEYDFIWEMTVTGNQESTINRATYTSDALDPDSFSVVALTTIEPIVVLEQAVVVDPISTTAGSSVHYTATITNNGTADAEVNNNSFVAFTLPAGFSYCGPGGGCAQPQVNGNGIADPAVVGDRITFTNGLVTIPAGGGQLILDFWVDVGGGVAPGLYTIIMQSYLRDGGFGKDVEIAAYEQAALLVDATKSEPPVIDAPITAGATTVTGTTSEGSGTTVTVFVNGNSVPSVIAGGGGVFSATVPTLFGGQHINGTAQNTANSELGSDHSSPDVVVAGVNSVTQCNDGIDNDGDGLIDSADPGCVDALDPDETDVPQCADGIDNDGDGDTDYPDDQSCSDFSDNDETGPPACGDGIDNDGDGDVDLDDPGCDDASDTSELDAPQCSNFIDDDGDGLIDYPNDPGCDSAWDDDELGGSGIGGSGGGSTSSSGIGGSSSGAGGSGVIGNGDPPDLGGVSSGGDEADSEGGCGCRVAGRDSGGLAAFPLLLLGLALGLRRRTRWQR